MYNPRIINTLQHIRSLCYTKSPEVMIGFGVPCDGDF